MNKKSIAMVGLSVLIALILVAGVVSAGFITFRVLAGSDSPFTINESSSHGVITETETPVGSEIDLADLYAPFWETWDILHEFYVDQPLDDDKMMRGAQDALLVFMEEAGIDPTSVNLPGDALTVKELSQQANTPRELKNTFAPFWSTWQTLLYSSMDAETSYQSVMQTALRGMIASLGDPHTAYMDPEEYRQINIPLEGEYEGIGAWVDPTGDYLTIISPMEGSPAETAGLLPGDVIIAVDGDDMTGISGDLVIRRVLGPAGSTVVLTITRENESAPMDIPVIRARITIPSVEGEIIEGNIAYIQLYNFGENTTIDLRILLEELLAENPKGIILDLRNNGGGYLHTAINITSEFINEGVALYEEYGNGERESKEIISGGLATDIPMVVLVNEGSASASEILAGAIQDYGRGVLVGVTTYGKGSVQLPKNLKNGRGALRVTIARWLTPNGRLIHGVGLEPDFIVEITEEDFNAQIDPQLDKAIELIQSY